MDRQNHAEANAVCQSIETMEIASDQSTEALPETSRPNVASTESTAHEHISFDLSSMSPPEDIELTDLNVTTLEYTYEAATLSPDECVDNTSTPLSGDYIYIWPVTSPGIAEMQLNEFLDLAGTHDISVNPTDPTICGSYYVPMQARPLLSYTEHLRAIYSPGPQFLADFDPHKQIHLDGTAHTNIDCVSGEYLNAEEL